MKVIKYSEVALNDGRVSDVWISTDEYIRDCGRRKSIKDMNMTVTVFVDTVYLHFIGSDTTSGIFLGRIFEE